MKFATACRVTATAILAVSQLALLSAPVDAQQDPTTAARTSDPPRRRTIRTPRFILHTDLSEADARRTLDQMEATIAFAARYWRQESHGQIECYVVHDLEAWPDSAFPNPLVRLWIGGIGGATIGETHGRTRASTRATVFAAARPGIPEHEVVHAYCCQVFGNMGPDWYKEGMAEMAAFGLSKNEGMNCPPYVMLALRNEGRRSIPHIIAGDDIAARISHSLAERLRNRQNQWSHLRMQEWTAEDSERVRRVKTTYYWSWALCHLLVHNPNYSDRFRALGVEYMETGDGSFDRMFGELGPELTFEFDQLVRHMAVGYRADLCRWDWTHKFAPLSPAGEATCHIMAGRGYQPSGLTLVAGEHYAFHADGEWQTSASGTACGPDGDVFGRGRLVAVLVDQYRMGQPFALGSSGTFEAPGGGDLYLRCRDEWHQLDDNQGRLRVRLTRSAPPPTAGR
jgi:hypothetical protein